MKLSLASLCVVAASAVGILLPAPAARAQSGILLKTFDVKAGKLLLDPVRPRLYATLPQDNSLAVIDTDTNTVLTTFFIGSTPFDLTISLDGTRLYVANRGSTSAAVGVVDLTTLNVLPSLPAPFNPVSIAAGLGGRLYLLNSAQGFNAIAQIDSATGTLQATFGGSTADYTGFIRITPDGKTLVYGNSGISVATLARFDVSTATASQLQTNNYKDIGENGEGLTISHNGRFMVFPNGGGNGAGYSTSLIPTSDVLGVLGTFQTGVYPGIATFSADDSLLYQVQKSGGYNGQSVFKVFNTATFTQVDSFADPSLGASSGYVPAITGIAVTVPSGYLYVAESSDAYGQTPNNLELISTQRAPFFDGAVALSNGFYYLKFSDGVPFGYYNFNYSPYLYHADLGFEYPYDAADGQGGIYLYDFKSKTFWYTSSSLFPYLYDFSLNAFLYYYPDPHNADRYNTNGTRYFYNFSTRRIITK